MREVSSTIFYLFQPCCTYVARVCRSDLSKDASGRAKHTTGTIHPAQNMPPTPQKRTMAPSKRKASNAPTKAVFIICPGASSKLPTELKDALKPLGLTRVLPKWKGIMPSHVDANINLVLELCRTTADELPDRKIVLVGHSFGTRVIVTLLTKIRDGQLAESIPDSLQLDRAILESYPLYGPSKPKPTTDRAVTLETAPDNLRCLFFSGEKDEFLDRRKNWRNDANDNIGGAALKEVVARMPSSDLCTVVLVPEGKHNALKVSKSNQQIVTKRFQNAVKDLLGDEFDLEPSGNTKGSLKDFFTSKNKKAKTS